MPLHDGDLRALFGELRIRERSQTPPYRPVRVARASRVRWRLAIAFALLFVLTGAIVVTRYVAPRHSVVSRTAVVLNWQGPTDFLLQTPQAGLLRNVPQFGAPISAVTKKGT